MADAAGVAIVGFNPPLSAAIAEGSLLAWPAKGRFDIVSEDSGMNETTVGELSEYALDFVESLG